MQRAVDLGSRAASIKLVDRDCFRGGKNTVVVLNGRGVARKSGYG
jgi:hypothetical protein